MVGEFDSTSILRTASHGLPFEIVGYSKHPGPHNGPGSLEEEIRLLPEGTGVVPVTIGFKAG